MCSCHIDYFKEEGHSYIKHLIHFHCKCKEDDHEIYVHFCGSHPWGTRILSVTDHAGVNLKKYFCKKELANCICEHCISVRYSLNFLCHKICVDKTKFFKEYLKKIKAIPLNDYLKKPKCEPFFYFQNNRIMVSLDNPECHVLFQTDSRPVLLRS